MNEWIHICPICAPRQLDVASGWAFVDFPQKLWTINIGLYVPQNDTLRELGSIILEACGHCIYNMYIGDTGSSKFK